MWSPHRVHCRFDAPPSNDNRYRIEQRCNPCPDSAWLLLVGFFAALLAVMGFGLYLQGKAMNFAGFSIGVVRSGVVHACGGGYLLACST